MVADFADRDDDLKLPSFARQLSRIERLDLTTHILQDAFASFGECPVEWWDLRAGAGRWPSSYPRAAKVRARGGCDRFERTRWSPDRRRQFRGEAAISPE